MSNVAKKEIILVPGAEMTVKQVGENQVLTIYEPVDEPDLFIVYYEGCPKNTIIQGEKRFVCAPDYLIPFESIQQYKDLLMSKCKPLEKYKTYKTV